MFNWRIKDITGQRFGRLVAKEMTNKRSGRGVVWQCLCDCGEIKLIDSHSLCRGHTKSCGCLHDERTSDRSLVDITGEKYGRLLVLELLPMRRQNRYAMWKCQCDCGVITVQCGADLRRGRIKSCGCSRYFTRFINGIKIDPMNVPIEVIHLMQARGKLKKAIKQAS